MLYHNVIVLAHYRRTIDAVLAGSAGLLSWYAAGGAALSTTGAFGVALGFSGLFAASFLVISTRFQVYHVRRTEHLDREIAALLEALAYALGLSCFVMEAATPGLAGRVYLWTGLTSGVFLLTAHAAMRFVVRRLRRAGREYRVWLIIGRNRRSADIVTGILENRSFGVRIAAILDFDSPGSPERRGLELFAQPPLSAVPQRRVADPQAVQEILKREIVDEVVVTLPLRSHYDAVHEILGICGAAGISVKLSPEVFNEPMTRTHVQYIGDIPMVTHFSGPVEGWQLMIKRVLDVGASALTLLLLSPFFAAAAIAIRVGTRGPVLFRQTRVGLHGREFAMLKFRTMVEDAPSRQQDLRTLNTAGDVVFKIRQDPRITRVGRVLRRYHLDELPQLWNVLVGDMSLVGPRALPPSEAIGNEWWQRRRLSMPPGMTCDWQVLEDRHDLPHRQWMELDLAYIDRWSVWTDLRLIARTLRMLPRGTGW